MASVETLTFEVQADTGPLDAALRRIQRSLAGLTRRLDRDFARLDLRLSLLSEPAPVIHVTITTPDAPSFLASRGQVEAMLADAVRRGRATDNRGQRTDVRNHLVS